MMILFTMKGEKYMDHDIQDPRNVTLYDKFFRMTIVVVTLPSWYFFVNLRAFCGFVIGKEC